MDITGAILFVIIVGGFVYWMKRNGKGPFDGE